MSFAVVGTIDDGASSAACRIARGVGVVKKAHSEADRAADRQKWAAWLRHAALIWCYNAV